MFGSSIQNLGSFSGIAANSRITFELPKRGTYNALFLRFGIAAGTGLTDANLLLEVGDIELQVNGITKVKLPSWSLRDLAIHKTGSAYVGVVPIYFYNPRWDSYAQRQDVSLGTADVSSLTLSCNLLAQQTLSTVDVYADWDESRIQPLGAHYCYGYQDFSYVAGSFDQNTINVFSKTSAIAAHHLIFPSTHSTVQPAGTLTSTAFGLWTPDITNLVVEADGVTKINNMRPEIIIPQTIASGYAPVTPLGLSLRYDGANYNAAVWPMTNVTKLRVRMTTANTGAAYQGITAGNGRIITEYVDGIGSANK